MIGWWVGDKRRNWRGNRSSHLGVNMIDRQMVLRKMKHWY
jgi:hypothetical protein